MAAKPTYEELEQRVKELEQAESVYNRIDKKLRESEERYKGLFKNMGSGVAIYEVKGDADDFIFIDFNEAAEKIDNQKKEELIGRSIFEARPGVEKFGLINVFREVWKTGVPKRHQITFYQDERLEAWYDNFIYKLPSGEIVAIFSDETNRKQAEEALRYSKLQFEAVLNNLDSGIYITDMDSHEILFMNKHMKDEFGEDLNGKICWKAIHNNLDGPCEFCTNGKLIDDDGNPKKPYVWEIYNQKLERWYELHDQAIPWLDGRIVRMEIAIDITDRKQTELSLRESEERFRTLFEDVPVGMQGYGPDGTIHYWNKASENIYGFKKDEAIGKKITELIIPPEMRDFVRDVIKQGTETGEMPPPEELLLMRQNGSRVPVFTTHLVLKVDEKEPELYCLDVDMTVQKRLQDQLRQAQKMEAIGTLAGGIAHQFNNALSVITGNIGLLEIDFPGDENVAYYAKEVKASARQMTHLAAQLLAYARGGRYQAKTVSLSDFIKETLPLVKHAIDSAIHVETNLPSDVLKVKVDQTQMKTVLSAVLSNASEAMEGKGSIRVACRDTVITDEALGDFLELTPGNYVCLTIVDDGKGMDEETRNRIFEPFFTTKFIGNGLGMAAAFGIVKNHGGGISVDSELGRGTTVKIYLPIIESVQARPAGLPVDETPVKEDSQPKTEWTKGTGTILVIEDEEPVMKVTRTILERMGYRVLEARTGRKAVDVVKTFDGKIDLALLDILMPDMTGNDIYPLIIKVRPDLKVIVFSGYSIDGPAQEILNAGAEDFIQKPFEMAELSEKLKKILGGGQ